MFSQHRLGNITAPPLQIVGDVFHDVRQLQSFPEPYADLGHASDIPVSQAPAVGTHEIGPELPDAAGHIVGVPVESLEGLQCGEISGGVPGEHRQIHFHAPHERRHELPDAAPVLRRELLKHGEALIQSFEQLPLSRILLDRANGLLDFTDLTQRHLIADELGFQLAEVIDRRGRSISSVSAMVSAALAKR